MALDVTGVPRAAVGEPRRASFWLLAGSLWAVFGIALSNALLGLSILAAPWAARAKRETLRRAAPLLAILALYALLLLVSCAASADPARSGRSLTELFNLAVLPLALLVVRDTRDARRVVDGLALVAGVLALVGLAQFLLGYDDLSRRVLGPFSHYMTFSGVLLVAALLLAAGLAAGRGGPGRAGAWRWVALTAIVLALVATFTRSAWVGLVVAFGLLIFLKAPRWLAALPLAALLFALLAPAPVLERAGSIFDLEDRSNRDRLSMAWSGLAMVADRPLVGLGPEMVKDFYPRYRTDGAVRDIVPHLHNNFLQLAAERGLPALGAYLALMAIVAAVAWRRFRHEGGFRGERGDLYLGVLLVLVGFNVSGLFEYNWGDTEIQRQVLFLLAVPFALPASASNLREL